MTKKNLLAASILCAITTNVSAVTLYSDENGDYIKLYGEVGIGGHFGADYDSGEFYTDEQSYIDDSFSTIGVKGQNSHLLFRLELDYERENWGGGSGDMTMAIDKMFIGYEFNDHNYIEAGLTDTAFDDYDKWGDYTFDTTVETGEAGDQDKTLKYEGNYAGFRVGASFTYNAESSSGSELGNIVNAYLGYFADRYSLVLGAESRNGSGGKSKYGEQSLLGFGARYQVTDELHLGINGFYEKEDIALDIVTVDNRDSENKIRVYNNYQTLKHLGALLSAKYVFSDQWEVVTSLNLEEYEHWDPQSSKWSGRHYEWGKSRTWSTLGVNYKPTKNSVLAIELSQGDAAQDAYTYARIYF